MVDVFSHTSFSQFYFILEYFQDRDGPNVGHRLKDYMVPFFPLVQNNNGFAKAEDLGYMYDYINEGKIF